MKKLLYAVASLLVLLTLWGLVEPRVILDEPREEVVIPGLPPSWEGRSIAVLADLQIGMWLANEGMVRRAIGRVVEARPAALLLAGDFLYKALDEETQEEAREELEAEDLRAVQEQIARVVGLLQPVMAAGIPTYAVLGNHDYLTEVPAAVSRPGAADALASALKRSGVTVLRNEAVVMNPGDGSPLYLGGIDSSYAGRAQPARMLAAIPEEAPRLVLMHNPDAFVELPPGSAPLAVAAHTHGGQVRIPGFPRWSWMSLKQEGRVTADGWISGYGAQGNRLYVNRGIGFSLAPLRIFCPPELTWITLRGPDPGRRAGDPGRRRAGGQGLRTRDDSAAGAPSEQAQPLYARSADAASRRARVRMHRPPGPPFAGAPQGGWSRH